MRLLDKEFELFVTQQEIESAIARIAHEISSDYSDKCPLFVGVLNGCFRFTGEFFKHYNGACEVSFVKMASYQGLTSTGIVETLLDISATIEGRDVIILEDIVDSGRTLQHLVNHFSDKNINSFKIATLFYKPASYDKEYEIFYKGIELPSEFVVGYGLDYNERGRELNDLHILKSE
jgi:adenylate kinase